MRYRQLKLVTGAMMGLLVIGSVGVALLRVVLFAPVAHAQAPQTRPAASAPELVAEGAALFKVNCAGCHFSDSTEVKGGPGLKGVLKGEKLPATGRPATEENVRTQLKAPFRDMPPFGHLSADKVDAIVAFLQSL